uniref:Condensin-2 complex subunit H2 n=1 Tax=Oncorhynchus tshawytscha TaxID=74940 RepID=A0A8C8D9F4_ONCTS
MDTLTKNWDIDVASELADYLEELDEMCISFDWGKTTLNFAEAALLIQGSACIYSKKVEHLYNLQPYFLMEHITSEGCRINVCLCIFPVCMCCSLKGEVLGSCKDFRMNTFTPDSLGIIRLFLASSQSHFLRDALSDAPLVPLAAGDAMSGVAGDDGADAGSENFLTLEDNGMEMDQGPEEHIDRHQAPSEGRLLRERGGVQQLSEEEQKKQRKEEVRAQTDKPLKTGKCYKVPPGLDDSGKRKRKGLSALQDFWTWYTGTCKRTYLQLDEREEREEELEGLRHHDLLGLLDDLSDNEHDPLTDEAPADFLSGQDFVPGRHCPEQFLVNSQGYAQETALSKRVKEWEDKIRPELTYQEVRATFDIHDYGDRIVAALSSVGQRRTFSSIVHGMDNFEACKYMLASLQLANDYTLEIDRSEGLEESIDTMGLTLLSKHRANQRFKKAPAATSDPI